MDAVDQIETLFGPGPFPHFQRSLGLLRPVGRNILPRVLTSVVIGWLPLVVLVAVAGHDRWNSLLSFAGDLGTHARSLIAAPLFILCEVACLKRLAAIVHQFPRSGVTATARITNTTSTISSMPYRLEIFLRSAT